MKNTFVSDIREREPIEDVFLVREKIMALAKNGKPYMTVKLMDRTGEVEGRIWDRVEEFGSRFQRDDFLRIRGKASLYLGKMQVVVQDLARVPESEVDLGEFLPVSSRPREEMVAAFREQVAGVRDPDYRNLLDAFAGDESFLRKFSTAPAAKSMHHAYLGGLLEHSLAVAELACEIGGRYKGVDTELLVTGALLHDIGKTEELAYLRSFEYTDDGKLLGHIMIGVEMLDAKIRGIESFPREKASLLKHLILSHHGQYEFGSPKRPKTLEGVILNMLDDLDAKINGVSEHLKNDMNGDSSWTGYHRLMERYFYKGNNGDDGRTSVAADTKKADPPPQPITEPKTERKPRPAGGGQKPLRVSLGEQLKEKNLELFLNRDEEKD
ncbi:MAG: HD domain-containing protein [Deltaproteobacteria bacterium]|nr:HD domain-containing protein [Deltaproteobacteria bacterium]